VANYQIYLINESYSKDYVKSPRPNRYEGTVNYHIVNVFIFEWMYRSTGCLASTFETHELINLVRGFSDALI